MSVCVCVCVCVLLCVYLSLASDSSETIKVIIIKLGMETAWGMRMHHFYINYDIDINSRSHRSYTNCLITSETFQAMPIKFTVKIVWRKVYIIFPQSDDPDFQSRSQLNGLNGLTTLF